MWWWNRPTTGADPRFHRDISYECSSRKHVRNEASDTSRRGSVCRMCGYGKLGRSDRAGAGWPPPDALPARGTAGPKVPFGCCGYSFSTPVRSSRCWSLSFTRHKFSTLSCMAASTHCPRPGPLYLDHVSAEPAGNCVQVGPACTCVKSRIRTSFNALPTVCLPTHFHESALPLARHQADLFNSSNQLID